MDAEEQARELRRILGSGKVGATWRELGEAWGLTPENAMRVGVDPRFQANPYLAARIAHFRGFIDPAPEVFACLAERESKELIRSFWLEEAKQAARRRRQRGD